MAHYHSRRRRSRKQPEDQPARQGQVARRRPRPCHAGCVRLPLLRRPQPGDAARKRLPRRREGCACARHDKPNVWPMAYERPAMSVERLLACGQRRRETQTAAYRPDRRRPLGTLPLVPGARGAGQRAARGSPERRGAATRNTGEHLGHPQHIHLVPLQRTPVPCRRGRRQDLRLRPHRGFVARPLASPLRSRRADHCSKQLTHQLTTPAPRRTRAPTPYGQRRKACAATLGDRRTRTTTRACCRFLRCPSPAGLRRHRGLINRLASCLAEGVETFRARHHSLPESAFEPLSAALFWPG